MVKIPQRKNHKTMKGKDLLNKAVFGTHITKSEKLKKEEELNKVINNNIVK